LERRRQIGLTIDPATAETEFWEVNAHDPYEILDEKYHGDILVTRYYARNPGASQKDWILLYDLARTTRTAFRSRDDRLIDLAEYEIEFERRRRIGVTIDPATAETASWWRDFADPYGILPVIFGMASHGTNTLREIPAESGYGSATCLKRRTTFWRIATRAS
jgi:hypothetical protein